MKTNKRIEYWNEIKKESQRTLHKILKLQKHPNHYIEKKKAKRELLKKKFTNNITKSK